MALVCDSHRFPNESHHSINIMLLFNSSIIVALILLYLCLSTVHSPHAELCVAYIYDQLYCAVLQLVTDIFQVIKSWHQLPFIAINI